ncbi:MAG: hypothetical protein NVS3B16_07110 [Vulcanimicrobiaceae bacterium]
MRARAWLVASGLAAAALAAFVPPVARAMPPPAAPRSAPSTSAAPVVPGVTLPFGSTILLVLDDKIDSGSTKSGTIVRMHLRAPLIANGATIAPAGTPATLAIVSTRGARSGDVDGAVQIHLDPIALPGHAEALPVRAYHEFLTIERTAGQDATRGTTDTLADIFVPYHMLYHAFRRGRQLVLPPGSVLRAQTGATIDASDPKAFVLTTPPPFVSTNDVPHADLTAPPYYTPAPGRPKPLPKGKPTLPPTSAPTVTPVETPAPAASVSPAP